MAANHPEGAEDKAAIIQQAHAMLKERFASEATGHDYWHMYRVWKLAMHIAQTEDGVDMFTLELAALLHDIADWKFHDGDEEAGPKAARTWLESVAVDNQVIEHIEAIIRTVSFKGAGVASNMQTIEGKIIHDADKLDAMGAIGIARTFAYGGAHHRPMYDPAIAPTQHTDFAAYKASTAPTINHFYEKLLLLKDRMYTTTGKQLAGERHVYMEQFLAAFYKEWEGAA